MGYVPISVAIITKNESENIADCIKSVSWADEVIVLDDYSTDKTVNIARQFTNKVYRRKMDIEGKHRNYAYSLAKNDWVLSLDADERATEELGHEIDDMLKKGTGHKAFTVPIKTYIGGYWIERGGWYPAGKVRLFNRHFFKYEEVEVHPRVFINGSCGHLRGDIVHYSYRDFSDFLRSVDNQTTLEAKKWFNEKREIGCLKALRKTADRFLKTYFIKKGYRDGMVGFMVAYFNGLYQLLSYAKYRQMLESEKPGSQGIKLKGRSYPDEKRLKVTAAIIAKNEEENIVRCLESLKWANEVILVDGISTDRTVEIAKSYGSRVIQHAFSGSFADDRNIGMKEARNDWILHVDADDVVTENFVLKLEKALDENADNIAVYKFRRKNFFLGHFMRYGGWHHYIPNLVNKKLAIYEGNVHEVPVYEGRVGVIDADIEHYPFKDISQFIEKQNRYTSIAAKEMLEKRGIMEEGKIKSEMKHRSWKTFWKTYVKKMGYREGYHGLLFSLLFSLINTLKWAKYWQLCYLKQEIKYK